MSSASSDVDETQGSSQARVSQYLGDSDLEDQDSETEDGSSSRGSELDQDSEDGEDSDNDNETRARPSTSRETAAIDSARQEIQKIPLKTLLKAQKRLFAQTGSSRASTSKVPAHIDAGPTTKHRKGREAPRRTMAPELTKRRPAQIKADDDNDANDDRPTKGKGKVKPHRDHKHAPTEVSSKRAVTRNRVVVEAPSVQRRDPRFDNLVGSYDPKTFQASYGFIDQARKDEIYRIRTALKATKKKGGAIDQVEREAMMQELTRLQSKQAAVEKEQREKTTMARWKEAEGKKQADGKKTFFLKSAERKKVLEESRMQDLQKDKRKLHKVMDRKKRTERRKDFRSAPPMRQA